MDSIIEDTSTGLDGLDAEAKVEFLITEYKKMEAALRESEKRYKDLVADSTAAIYEYSGSWTRSRS